MRHRLRDRDAHHGRETGLGKPEFVAQMDLQREAPAEKAPQKQEGHQQRSKRRPDRRARHAQPGSRQPQRHSEQMSFPGRINQHKIEDRVENVEGNIIEHRRARIPHAAQKRREKIDRHEERHRAADDPKIPGRVRLNRLLRSQKSRQRERQPHGQRSHKQPKRDVEQKRLPHHAASLFRLPGPDVLGHLHGKADRRRAQKAVEKPDGAGHHADRSRRVRAQRSDHDGVDILNQCEHELLDNRGPRQREDGGNFLPPRRCAALLKQRGK